VSDTTPSGVVDLSFLAPPGEISDWRLTVLVDAVAGAGVLDRLPGTAEEIAQALNLDAHSLRVMLDALVPWAVVERDDDGRYLLGPGAPPPHAVATIRHHARSLRAWSTTAGDRLRGVRYVQRSGIPEPELFFDALAATARRSAPGLVDSCLARFPQARRVLDLGGLHGEYSLEFARRGLDVTMQDLPAMVEIARRRGVLDQAGVTLFAGSFFEEVPGGPFDLAFCAGITHTFDGERNQTLFRRLRPVVAAGGGVAIATFLRHRHPMADIFAVQMLTNANGGDTHTEEEYRRWLGDAGFRVDGPPLDLPDRPQSILFAS